MTSVFISYRRKDSAMATGRIFDYLSQCFGEETLFRDIETMPLGSNFHDIIKTTIERCDIVLVIIGAQWLNILDDSGEQRLFSPGDLVRLEVVTALNSNAKVIPIYVDGAHILSADELPSDIALLPSLNSLILTDRNFHYEMRNLVKTIESILNIQAMNPESYFEEISQRALRKIINQRFTLDMLKTLCRDLHVEFENLDGVGKEGKARELIAQLKREQRLYELIEELKREYKIDLGQ